MLAKVVNDDVGILIQRGALRFSRASPLPQKSSFAFALAFDLAFNTQAGREAAVLLLLILICGPRQPRWPQVGTVERPAEPSRSAGMPSLGEAPSGGAKTFWLLWLGRHSGRLPKVTRCKSGTISRRYLNNGYVHNQTTTACRTCFSSSAFNPGSNLSCRANSSR